MVHEGGGRDHLQPAEKRVAVGSSGIPIPIDLAAAKERASFSTARALDKALNAPVLKRTWRERCATLRDIDRVFVELLVVFALGELRMSISIELG